MFNIFIGRVVEGGLSMKKYIIPKLMCIELRTEENIANTCTGSCNEEDAITYGYIYLEYS